MTKSYDYHILNVFATSKLQSGNQLAVIPKAEGLTNDEMLSITKQFNFSESTFVTSETKTEADLRIFTPEKEIEYAGHPTVGTLNILEMIWRKKGNSPRKTIYLNLMKGKVKGTIQQGVGDTLDCWFEQLSPSHLTIFEDRELIATSLGINSDLIFPNAPFYVISVGTMKFLFVRLNRASNLNKLSPNSNLLSTGIFAQENINIYVFANGGLDGGDIRARFFAPLYGIFEDPATGGVQSSFGLALLQYGLLKNDSTNDVTVEQGYEMGRPSKIQNSFQIKDGRLVKTVTGGQCFYFSKGTLYL